jgi:pilus assembly protein TadC
MSPLLVGVAVFVLLGIAGVCLTASAAARYHALGTRISDMGVKMRVAYGTLSADDIEEEGVARALFRWAVERMPEPKSDTAEGKRIVRLLTQAGYTGFRAAHVFQFIRLSSACILTTIAVVASIATDASGLHTVIIMIIAAAIGAWVPFYLVMRRAKERQFEIGNQLSSVLDLLVVCVEAGLGIIEAIKIVGSETERRGQEIGRELAMVSAELSAGSSLGQALRGLAERTSVEDVKPLAATMIQSEQLGAQMGPALRSISDGLRSTRRLRAEEAAQKTTIKILFPLVFFILPAMMAVIVGPAMIQVMRALSGVK